jgi:putative acetyltransferase
VVEQDDPGSPAAPALIERHLAFARAHSPPEDVHALEVTGLRDRDVSFFGIRNGDALVCMGALKQLEEGHGEIKSMPGTMAAFAPARALYAAAGFVVCEPFAGYGGSANSVCMTLDLDGSDAPPPGRRR